MWTDLLPADDPAPTDSDELKRSMDTVLTKTGTALGSEGKSRLVILIDALNQMDDEGNDD